MDKIKDWVVEVVKGIVSEPEKVTIEVSQDEQGVFLQLTVSPQDVGRVIGKEGIIANSLRTIVRSAGYMHNMRASLKIVAPEKNEY